VLTKPHSVQVRSPLPPYLYHLAEEENWASIQRHGLLSTSALLDLAGVTGSERESVERWHRTHLTALANGAIVRDQKPMPPAALDRCLRGMTPSDWYMLLNGRVFFWLDTDRLNRMLTANHPRPQVVLVLGTAQLLGAYSKRVELTPINTGNARRQPAVRGRQTFVPYRTWSESRWASEAEGLGVPARPRSHPPAEFTISYAVPDIMNFVQQARLLHTGECFS
jgi:hypothetical protein